MTALIQGGDQDKNWSLHMFQFMCQVGERMLKGFAFINASCRSDVWREQKGNISDVISV
jgi:hypothetical protein